MQTNQKYRCQFHQHFTHPFFERKSFAQFFSNNILALYFLTKEYRHKSFLYNVGEIDNW